MVGRSQHLGSSAKPAREAHNVASRKRQDTRRIMASCHFGETQELQAHSVSARRNDWFDSSCTSHCESNLISNTLELRHEDMPSTISAEVDKNADRNMRSGGSHMQAGTLQMLSARYSRGDARRSRGWMQFLSEPTEIGSGGV